MFRCRVDKHSISDTNGQEIVTFVVEYPRSILPEFNTHTIISKNTSSSRAVPYARAGIRKTNQPRTIREMVMEDPYLPIYWGRNEAGMQATSELNVEEIEHCKAEILRLRTLAVDCADTLWKIGMHKQDCNRYLEPWAWTTQVLTGTDWSNFFALRTHEAAHPAFRYIARIMYLCYRKSQASVVKEDDWHLPFIDKTDDADLATLKIMSVARCARASYTTFEGTRDRLKDVDLYEKLAGAFPKHMSPFQHQATPAGLKYKPSNFRGWNQLRKDIIGENILTFEPTEEQIIAWGIIDKDFWLG